MKIKHLLLLIPVVLYSSCESDLPATPDPESLIHEIAAFLTTKGYEVEVKDDNNLAANGNFGRIQFLRYINEFYSSRGFDEPYDLKNPEELRGDTQCYPGPIYQSGNALCQNFACFDEDENLVNFYTTCVSCEQCE